ncbi:very short patch repair endonuclease [Reyranella sp.]|uniref:very short patch repair endonuclease n=1 Tax=Reyranella sp. TaxID=1929291 RepID=UPI003BAABB2D
MVDTRTTEQRRRIMQSVQTRNTGPELAVRRLLHAEGYRFRLHRRDLPGSPDIVFPGRRAVIFVNGCFWHGHSCKKGRLPKSRNEYWDDKIAGNRARDRRKRTELTRLGWRVHDVWQCQIKDPVALARRLRKFLDYNR